MITILHTYYPPDQSIETLDLRKTLWTHSGTWKSIWEEIFPCKERYLISNRGKDIGGKLFAFQVLLEKRSEEKYALFLHDKKSPQVIDGEQWKKELWSIAEKEVLSKAIKTLDSNQTIGIVANKDAIIDPEQAGHEYAYASNKELLFSQAEHYDIVVKNKSFVAGSIFIARLQPYIEFFRENSPLAIRSKFEEGNVLDLDRGTYTHTWERLLSWIPVSKGYSIEAI